jgi:hypothetical protein
MRRTWLLVLALLVAGCGVEPSGVTDAGRAPTGVAPGVTLYFVDARDRLQPQLRRTDRLGTISDALALLLSEPRNSDVRTEIAPAEVTRVGVDTTRPGLIQLRVPLADYEVTQLGIDQIVCTALGVHVQRGGSKTTRVEVDLTSGSGEPRTCPLIS